ncbi:MAG: SPFH domain-containing protein [Candidatus Omnitrophica bacterium]|nr:SPFH domain-containing protein [Candidatus Omnitrophota bacterium]
MDSRLLRLLTRCLFAMIIPLVAGCVPHSTGSTEVGVRTVKWSLFAKKGVEQKIYAPGTTYFFLPLINDWHVFDTKLRNMEMTRSPGQGAHQGTDDLVFKTIDGNDISLDVIISYRIIPEKAPYILEFVARDNLELEEKVVRPITRNMTRDLFGELATEDFYVANKRTEKAESALRQLNALLQPYGVVVENVLPKDYRFNAAYQKAIEEKKVADQMSERYKSEVRATVEEYNQRLQQTQGEVNQIVAKADGEYAKAKIEADAYYEQQSRIAKAIEAEAVAESKGIEKMVEALNSSGGATMVKLRLAEALAGKEIYLLPMGESGGIDLKTTDINQLLKLYGVQKAAGQRQPLEQQKK